MMAIEVPDCGCRMPCFCMAGTGDGFPAREKCPGEDRCKDCPERPCPHVAAMRPENFPLSLEEWGGLLLSYDPSSYATPPPPKASRVAISREGWHAILMDRALAGEALSHPEDYSPLEKVCDHLGIVAQPGKVQGDTKAAWHEEDEDLGLGYDLDLDRKIDPDDPIALRARAFNQMASKAIERNAATKERRVPAPSRRPARCARTRTTIARPLTPDLLRQLLVRDDRPQRFRVASSDQRGMAWVIAEAHSRGFELSHANCASFVIHDRYGTAILELASLTDVAGVRVEILPENSPDESGDS